MAAAAASKQQPASSSSRRRPRRWQLNGLELRPPAGLPPRWCRMQNGARVQGPPAVAAHIIMRRAPTAARQSTQQSPSQPLRRQARPVQSPPGRLPASTPSPAGLARQAGPAGLAARRTDRELTRCCKGIPAPLVHPHPLQKRVDETGWICV
ncbi:uncharacterized protein PSFLO_05327 [Pseudozyma flocculosa]|uniref:Uncharacterized protein n=1 Tax=Pseudozyma flocculosa TaxID=84751 RepID=A0A5C3F705_9BASI|nr:uncharacterized protein PSFLO_05327 [Pseudozyma flocculosa]